MVVDAAPAGEAGDSPTSRDGRAEVRELERQLAEARAQLKDVEARAAENLDRWQRAQAELANFRRRVQFDREIEQKYAGAPLIGDVARVLDGFERAWRSVPERLRTLSWIDGIYILDRQLQGVLERHGVRVIDALGKPFDPRFHEAVASDPGDGSDHVVEVFQSGYELHDRVIRCALVRVGPKPAPAAQPGEVPEGDGAADGRG